MFASFLLLAAALHGAPTTVGGFTYKVVILSDRARRVKAPPEHERTWKERVEAVVATQAGDATLSRFARREALRSRRSYYGDSEQGNCWSFETCEFAGFMEVSEDVISASPDIVSLRIGTEFYIASMPHPNWQDVRSLNWSRRLKRILTQSDVFAVPPDRALRRLAQSNFDNRDNLQNPDNPNGIPLEWDHATIGPKGITWTFGPYELGGYPSAGDATVSWSTLKPYLRHKLPFAIRSIRSAPAER